MLTFPGRSIHHGMLLSNEMVHRARESGKAYIWLKVDIVKAFDKLEWHYVVKMLQKVGIKEDFIKFFTEITVGANAVVIVYKVGKTG
jgi:hypothetical protein